MATTGPCVFPPCNVPGTLLPAPPGPGPTAEELEDEDADAPEAVELDIDPDMDIELIDIELSAVVMGATDSDMETLTVLERGEAAICLAISSLVAESRCPRANVPMDEWRHTGRPQPISGSAYGNTC